jgi:regulator of protease activity HflC (stomatin/prohibitin superfamily)
MRKLILGGFMTLALATVGCTSERDQARQDQADAVREQADQRQENIEQRAEAQQEAVEQRAEARAEAIEEGQVSPTSMNVPMTQERCDELRDAQRTTDADRTSWQRCVDAGLVRQ